MMKTKMKTAFLGVAVALFLSGCVEGPPDTRPPGMTFANLKPVELDVASIEVKNNYTPPMQDPNVEHTFTTPPYVATESLVKKQLAAAGTENVLRVIIDDASVVREELPVTKGYMDVFLKEPSERLKAKVLLRFELYSPAAPDIILGRAEVLARREKMLMEEISLADRDRAYFSMTEDLMDDLNDGLRSTVANTFGKKF